MIFLPVKLKLHQLYCAIKIRSKTKNISEGDLNPEFVDLKVQIYPYEP